MAVDVVVRRTDIFLLNWFVALRSMIWWGVLAALTIWACLDLIATASPNNLLQYLIIFSIVPTTIGAMYLIGCALIFGLVALASSEKSGLGRHTFQIERDIFRATNELGENAIKWKGVDRVRKTKNYIYVRLNYYMYFLLPRRCFEHQNEFDNFYLLLMERTNEHQSERKTDLD